MKIIDRLKLFLESSDISVQECAKKMGISYPTAYRLINGVSDKSALLKVDAFLDGMNFYPTVTEKPTPSQPTEEA